MKKNLPHLCITILLQLVSGKFIKREITLRSASESSGGQF